MRAAIRGVRGSEAICARIKCVAGPDGRCFKRRFVTRNRPTALQFLDIAAYLADILMQRATLMLIDPGFVADRRF